MLEAVGDNAPCLDGNGCQAPMFFDIFDANKQCSVHDALNEPFCGFGTTCERMWSSKSNNMKLRRNVFDSPSNRLDNW